MENQNQLLFILNQRHNEFLNRPSQVDESAQVNIDLYSKTHKTHVNNIHFNKSRSNNKVPHALRPHSFNKAEEFKYVSKFIKNAEKTAQQRAKLALEARRKSRNVKNEWDSDITAPTLFDPNLKKQEIFKILPKNQRNSEKLLNSPNNKNNVIEKEANTDNVHRMTIKSHGVKDFYY